MEASLIRSSQVIPGRINDTSLSTPRRNLNFRNCSLNKSNIHGLKIVQSQSFVWSSGSAIRFSVRPSASSQTNAVTSEKTSKNRSIKSVNGVQLYVGLPLDTVSDCNTISHARAIAAGLKALKLLGVNGVELPVWWGIAEKEAMGKYDWTSYIAVAEMVQKLGMKLHVSLCFHACQEPEIPMPHWVSRIGESDPSIYFTDRSGHKYKDCLSLSVDDVPVLNGKSPLEVYGYFFASFKSAFAPFLGSTITGLSIGLGPDGELRYPSQQHRVENNSHPAHPGAGEFQCYDKNMLSKLKHHAESQGNPLWGLSGPHDAPSYDQSPLSGGFFAENGGSWETPYGDFFLSWYSSQLALHGDRILSLAATTFKDVPVMLSGRLPLMHSLSNTRSHPSEMTAGFYNMVGRNGYDVIAEIFARNSCSVILPSMELSDKDIPSEYLASPEGLIAEIISSCRKQGVEVAGENSRLCGGSKGFEQIKKNVMCEKAVTNVFTYQQMGAYFFSPEHFPAFTQFVRSLTQQHQSLDDLPVDDEDNAGSLSGKNMQMQAV